MKGADFGFHEVDVGNVDGVIEALGVTVRCLPIGSMK